ncbi:MAG: amidohydrolase family protein [Clostridia bacterium]
MFKCDILVNDCRILTSEYSIVKDHSIAIKDSLILEIGPSDEMKTKYEGKNVISGKGKLAMPGFVDGHTHTSQQLLRGRITDEYPVIYLRFNLPYESKLDEYDVGLCTSLSCLEMIKSGITSFADAGSTDIHKVVEKVSESGLRGALTRATSDKGDLLPPNMKDTTHDAIRKTEQLYQEFNGSADGRINIWFQFRSVATCSEELIRGVAEKAREYNTGLHTHLSEYNESILYTLGKYGIREVEFLDRLGAVGPNLLAAHSILINDRDIKTLKDCDAKIVHCPRSNLGKGFTKTPQLLSLGMSVGLGTDGTAHSGLSMFREMTAFRHSQVAQWGVPYFDSSVMSTRTLIEMATLGGAKALLLDDKIGTLEKGKKADMILINIDQPHIIPTHNLLNTLTETVETNDIVDVIVNGKVLMESRVVKSLDEEKLMFEAKNEYKRILGVNGWDDKLAVGEI